MKTRMERAVEVTALVVIGGAAALGGRDTLLQLHDRFFVIGVVVLAALSGVAIWSLMKLVRENRPDGRVAVSKRVAYLAAMLLGLCAVVSPARWAIGGSVAGFEIAIAFDIVSAFASAPQRAD